MTTSESIKEAISFGHVLGMVISWTTNHSILWAIAHGLFGWIYVIYYALGYGRR
jgi:hypothetical protein